MKQENSLSNGWICLTGIVHGSLNFRYIFKFSSEKDFQEVLLCIGVHKAAARYLHSFLSASCCSK